MAHRHSHNLLTAQVPVSVLAAACVFCAPRVYAEGASNPGVTGVQAWLLLAVVVGASYTFSLVRKEGTHRIGMLSLAIALSGYVGSLGSALALGSGIKWLELTFAAIAAICFPAATVLGVIGIATFNAKVSQRGRGQAIASVVIGLIGTSMIVAGAIIGYRSAVKAPVVAQADGAVYDFKDLNFKYSVPARKRLAKLDPSRLNPDATLLFKEGGAGVYLMVIAEATSDGSMSLDDLENIVKANLQSNVKGRIQWKTQAAVVNGMKGMRLSTSARMGNLDLAYRYWLFVSNGYIYQIVGWSTQREEESLARDFPVLASGFSLLDPGRVAGEKSRPLADVDSPYGFRTRLAGSRWRVWSDLGKQYPDAAFGGAIGVSTQFVVVPYCYGSDKPRELPITAALLQTVAIDYPNQKLRKIKRVTMGALSGEVLGYRYQSEGDQYDARLAIMSGTNCSYLVAGWSPGGDDETAQYMDSVFSHIEFADHGASPDTVDARHRLAHIHNYVGLYYFKQKSYPEALQYFERAHTLNSKHKTYLTNSLEALSDMDRYADGIALIKTSDPSLAQLPEVLSWKGWNLLQLGRTAEGVDVYYSAFQKGFRNDSELGNLVDSMLKLKRYKEADRALAQFAQDPANIDIVTQRAAVKRKEGQFDASLKLLDDAQKGRPYNATITFAKIDTFSAMGKDRKILDLVSELEKIQGPSADSYFERGKAEYRLGWFKRAKAAFEAARQRVPDSQAVQQYLTMTMGQLGQGDSGTIAGRIKPVSFPALAAVDHVNSSLEGGYDSVYLVRGTAFEFKRGKRLKRTVYTRVRILNQNGVDRFSTLTRNFDPFFERAYVNSLVVTDKTGKVVAEGKRDDYFVQDKDSDEADLEKTIHIPVPNLKPGYTIELVTTTQSLQPVYEFPYERLYVAASRPVRQSFVYVTGDVDTIASAEQKVAPARRDGNSLYWLARYPEPYVWEPYAVDHSRYLARVELSARGKDWHTLSAEYEKDISGKLNAGGKVEKLAASLTRGLSTDGEKVDALAAYVQKNITYRALEFGVRGRIPNTADQTLAHGFGDCKDHAVLLRDLLTYAGYPSRLVLVNTGEPIAAGLPSLDQFNHMIVTTSVDGKRLFFDTTDKDSYLDGSVPYGLANRKALIVGDVDPELVKIPAYKETRDDIDIQRSLDVGDDGVVTANERVRFSSFVGSSMRNFIKTLEPSKKYEWIQGYINDVDSGVTIENFQIENLYDDAKALVFELKYKFPAEKGVDGGYRVRDPAVWEQHYVAADSVHHRRRDFEIDFPFRLAGEVRIKASGNVSLAPVGNPLNDASRSFGRFSSRWEPSKGHALVKHYTVREHAGIYPAAEYADFSSFSDKALKDIRVDVQVAGPVTVSQE